MKDIKQYLHLYLGCECLVQFPEDRDGIKCILDVVSDECATFTNYAPDYYFEEPECGVKPILRPLSDMTEEEFKEFSKPKVFASAGGTWYACSREIDPEAFDGDVSQHIIEHINDACDDDPENVIICNIRSKHISYGWIEYEERYHGFGEKEPDPFGFFLNSEAFDLFGLIDAGLAIDKSTLK